MSKPFRVIDPVDIDDDEDIGMPAAAAVVAIWSALCVLVGALVAGIAMTVGRGTGCGL